MALVLGDNLELGSTLPNFSRDMFETIAAMKEYSDDSLPNVFIAGNKEDGKYYIYNSTNSSTDNYGRWRPFNNVQVEKIDSDIPNGSIVQFVGATTSDYSRGHFYLVETTKPSVTFETSLVEGSKLAISVNNISKALDVLNGKENGDYEITCTVSKGTDPAVFEFDGSTKDVADFGLEVSGRKILAGDKIIMHYTKGTYSTTSISTGSGGGADVEEETEIIDWTSVNFDE